MNTNQLKDICLNNNIPIIKKPLEDFLTSFIKEKKIKKILEIGSAWGYSSIIMALVNKDIFITTLEKDENRFKKALEYINKFNLSKQITLKHEDALKIKLDEMYDLIFIDAAKTANIKFFEKFKNNLKENGYIIVDNLGFHGFVKDSSNASKNVLRIVGKIKEFINYLEENKKFKTQIKEIGDTISISWRNNENIN